jgi:hypothetical protein
MGSCTAPSAKGDDKFITTDYLQQCQVNYPDDFVKQAWEQPEINLFIVCVATKKGAVREIKGGMAVFTSIPASNGLELSRALDDVLRKSNELRSLAGQKNNVFLPAKVGIAGDPLQNKSCLVFFISSA